MTNAQRPLDTLNDGINNQVLVVLKGNKEIRGKMLSYDIHMNLAIEGAEELVDGEMKRKLGLVVVRGDNILYVLL